MKKVNFLFIVIQFLSPVLVYSCSDEKEESEHQVRTQYTLTISASEGGSVTPDANGTYNQGATITVTAIPDEGYHFDRWEGTDNDYRPNGCWAGPGNCRAAITMNSNRDVIAFFQINSQ
jgi:hypothetical protein